MDDIDGTRILHLYDRNDPFKLDTVGTSGSLWRSRDSKDSPDAAFQIRIV